VESQVAAKIEPLGPIPRKAEERPRHKGIIPTIHLAHLLTLQKRALLTQAIGYTLYLIPLGRTGDLTILDPSKTETSLNPQ